MCLMDWRLLAQPFHFLFNVCFQSGQLISSWGHGFLVKLGGPCVAYIFSHKVFLSPRFGVEGLGCSYIGLFKCPRYG